MKRTHVISKMVLTVFATIALLACEDENNDPTSTQEVSTTHLTLAAQTDAVEDDGFAIIDYAIDEKIEVTRSAQDSFFAACAVVTLEGNGDGSGVITIDFGDSCTLNNGATVSGQINIGYQAEIGVSRTVSYTYSNFTYNGNAVDGAGTIQRLRQNAEGNPQSDVTASITVTFENGNTASRTVNKTRIWIEGHGSGTWTDNAFAVTGNWETSFSTGFTRSGEVIETLRREASCPHFVSGTLAITQNQTSGTLDYGDGNCDNIAVVMLGSQEFTIQL